MSDQFFHDRQAVQDRMSSQWPLLVAVALSVAIFAFDLCVELGVAVGVLYVAVICLCYMGRSRRVIWLAAGFTASLALLGYLLSEAGGEAWKVLLNRFLAVFAICLTAGFVDLAKTQTFVLKNRELHLRQRTRQLGQSEEKMRQTFESSPTGLLIVNDRGEITMANSQLVKMFGHTRSEMVGQSLNVFIPDQHSRRNVDDGEHLSASRGIHRAQRERKEVTALRKDGTEFAVEVVLAPIDDTSGFATMVTVIDISERKKTQKSIQAKNDQLLRLNTELLEFAYSASHDLTAPLSSIIGLLDICSSDLAIGDIDEVLVNISKAKALAQRLTNRVDSTLSLAKSSMELGDWESISVAARVEEAWDALPHDGVMLETLFAHKEPVHTVAARFDAILENLLSNAIKYQKPKEQAKKVSVRTWTFDDNFCLSVKDNGVGIPESQQNKVFRLFHRLAVPDTVGTGLGLPLVSKSVSRLGGCIELESKNGTTTFTVSLPQGVGTPPISE